ncbi:hypothetical protein BC835DRAFT_1344137 [Cytidiella melzeri]|nr:hypothetical protein BC835DRAFT_1344137 [Cytidiella melzeri]
MDRGGRGRGGPGPSRQGSSLPLTLHGSLLQPGAGEAGARDTVHDEPQPMTEAESTHTPYAHHPRLARSAASAYHPTIASAPPTHAYEEHTHQDPTGAQRSHTTSFERSLPQEPQLPALPLPPIQPPVEAELYHHQQFEVTATSRYSELESYASAPQARVSNLYNQPVAHYSRTANASLPSLSFIQSEFQQGSSDQRFEPPQPSTVDYRQRRWVPQHTSRPIVPLPRTARSLPHVPLQQQISLGWNYQHVGTSHEYHNVPHMPSDMGDWAIDSRHDEMPMHSSRHTPSHRTCSVSMSTVSADRSTISAGPSFAGPSRSEQFQYAAQIHTPPPRRATQDSQAIMTPYYGGHTMPQYDPPPHPPPNHSQQSVTVSAQSQTLRGVHVEYIPEPESLPDLPLGEGRVGLHYGLSQVAGDPEDRVQSITPLPTSATTVASSSRKHQKEDVEMSDEDRPRKVSKKVAIACNFCRCKSLVSNDFREALEKDTNPCILDRKLKCDGHRPTCANCFRRQTACGYVDHQNRRGPGKAPKGQRSANRKAKAVAAQAASESSHTSRAPSVTASQEMHRRGSREAVSSYSMSSPPQASQQTHLPPPHAPPSFGSGSEASFDFNYARPHSTQFQLGYPEPTDPRIFDMTADLSGYSQHAPYMLMPARMASAGHWSSGQAPPPSTTLRESGNEFEGSPSAPFYEEQRRRPHGDDTTPEPPPQ